MVGYDDAMTTLIINRLDEVLRTVPAGLARQGMLAGYKSCGGMLPPALRWFLATAERERDLADKSLDERAPYYRGHVEAILWTLTAADQIGGQVGRAA
jgi:hypothetical protein